jgi:hypothetical protein
LHATRIATGEARLVIGGDAIVSASAEVLAKTRHNLTAAVVNSASTPTADFIKDPKWKFPGASAEQDLRANVGDACAFIDASAWAVTLLADAIYSNPLLLGFAWQKGWIPLLRDSLVRAIELSRPPWRGCGQGAVAVRPARPGGGHAADAGRADPPARGHADRLPERRLCGALSQRGRAHPHRRAATRRRQ